MYNLAIKKEFVAQHYLIGGDWGKENENHSHCYEIEVRLEGEVLDEHGYLVDIVDVEANLNELVEYFKDKTLNELPEFNALNPSIEHFVRIFCNKFIEKTHAPNVTAVRVKIWENKNAWACYRKEL